MFLSLSFTIRGLSEHLLVHKLSACWFFYTLWWYINTFSKFNLEYKTSLLQTVTSKQRWSPTGCQKLFSASLFSSEVQWNLRSIFIPSAQSNCSKTCRDVCFMIQQSSCITIHTDCVKNYYVKHIYVPGVFTCSWNSWSQAIAPIIKYLTQTSPNAKILLHTH